MKSKVLIYLCAIISIFFVFSEVNGVPLVQENGITASIEDEKPVIRTKRLFPIVPVGVMVFLAAVDVAEAYVDLEHEEQEEKDSRTC